MPGCRAIKKYPLAWWLNDHQGWGSCKQRDRVVEGDLLPFAALCTHQKFYDQFVVTNCHPGSSYLTANKPRCSAPTCLFARLYILAKNALPVPWKSASRSTAKILLRNARICFLADVYVWLKIRKWVWRFFDITVYYRSLSICSSFPNFSIIENSRIFEYSFYTIIYLFGSCFLEIQAFEEYYDESFKVVQRIEHVRVLCY